MYQQAFLSYSRGDRPHVSWYMRHSKEFRSVVWYDEHLERSNDNWRAALEQSIQNSAAVLVFCSPNARASQSVSAEVELARAYGKPIFPLWIHGDDWALSAPFSLISANYTDMRGGLDQCLRSIEPILANIQAAWPQVSIGLLKDVRETLRDEFLVSIDVGANTFAFARFAPEMTVGQLIQALYEAVDIGLPPFTYGSEWWLETRTSGILALPAYWARRAGSIIGPESSVWLSYPLSKLGIKAGSNLKVRRCDPNKLNPVGVFCEPQELPLVLGYASKFPFAHAYCSVVGDELMAELEDKQTPQFVVEMRTLLKNLSSNRRVELAGSTLLVGEVYRINSGEGRRLRMAPQP